MEELESRLSALELLVMERLAADPLALLNTVRATLRQGLEGALDAGDRARRLYALDVLDDAIVRFDEVEPS